MAHPIAVALLVALAVAACGTEAPPRPAPTLIAHRGASGHLPEHTRRAYDLALEQGADYLEHDLHRTRDGVLVVVHDDTLERTARGPAEDCSGAVAEKTLAQLRRCDFGAWFWERRPRPALPPAAAEILTLDQVLDRYRDRARFYIETKDPDEAPGMETELLAALERHDLRPQSRDDRTVIVQSFSPKSLARLHASWPELPLVLLVEAGELPRPLDAGLERIAETAVGIGPHRGDVDAELVETAHRHGLVIHPWTVNDTDEIARLLSLGVDGIFTDYPDRFREVCCEEASTPVRDTEAR